MLYYPSIKQESWSQSPLSEWFNLHDLQEYQTIGEAVLHAFKPSV